jgi:hypothetical protein
MRRRRQRHTCGDRDSITDWPRNSWAHGACVSYSVKSYTSCLGGALLASRRWAARESRSSESTRRLLTWRYGGRA